MARALAFIEHKSCLSAGVHASWNVIAATDRCDPRRCELQSCELHAGALYVMPCYLPFFSLPPMFLFCFFITAIGLIAMIGSGFVGKKAPPPSGASGSEMASKLESLATSKHENAADL